MSAFSFRTSWGTGDYTSTNSTSQPLAGWATYNVFNITSMLQDAYDAGKNYGFVIHHTAGAPCYLHDADNTYRNFHSPAWAPQLRIQYHYSAQ